MLRTKLLITAIVMMGRAGVAQQDTAVVRYANTITEADLRTHLTILASDAYEGREAGMKGQKMAAEYLKQQFIAFGIPAVPVAAEHGLVDGYFQPFGLVVEQPGSLVLEMGGKQYRFLEDQLYFSNRTPADIGFAELVYTNVPGLSVLPTGTRAALVLLPVKDKTSVVDMAQLTALGAAFTAQGGELLLVATESFVPTKQEYGHWLGGTRMRLADAAPTKASKQSAQVMVISPAVATAIMVKGNMVYAKELKRALKSKAAKARTIAMDVSILNRPMRTPLSSENVLAYIEGGDKRDEVVVVTAHYDHIGAHDGEVYNGADDDGSGTVALLEMAQAFAQAKREGRGPRRSILFMPVSAEEKGLLGSEYYSDHPVFPMENTVCNLNIDMIGRTDSAHAQSAPYVYIIGSNRLSTELHAVNQRANDVYVGIDLDETFNALDDPNRFYFRSDHYNFARKGVPVIFYFSGVHEDYHQPGDETEKIRFDLLRQRTALVFHTAWEVANREGRLVVDGKVEDE
ncbi:MAG: M28 family peptidase [Flavobacteriales bacterium]|nr:M28 family peptidase [Flavobacteriales bacterium]